MNNIIQSKNHLTVYILQPLINKFILYRMCKLTTVLTCHSRTIIGGTHHRQLKFSQFVTFFLTPLNSISSPSRPVIYVQCPIGLVSNSFISFHKHQHFIGAVIHFLLLKVSHFKKKILLLNKIIKLFY